MKTYLKKLQSKLLLTYETNKNNPLLKVVLYIASQIYMLGYQSRLALYKLGFLKSYSLPAYVISIGNITCGGTGKTPFAIETAKYFLSKGHKVAILSRGYGGDSAKETTLVSDGSEILSDYEICGEEPILIAKKVPKALVLVGKDRVKTGESAIKLGADVLVLDDGFQHIKLKRNRDILLLDSYNPFDNGHLLPLGKLREQTNSIQRASSIVITNTDKKELNKKELQRIQRHNKTIARVSSILTKLHSLNTKEIININDAKDLKILACCGIGNPQSFIDSLKRHQLDIQAHFFYPDHYEYSYSDIEQIVNLAKKYSITNVIVTEKDGIKIEPLCQAAQVTFWTAELELRWDMPNLFESIFQTE